MQQEEIQKKTVSETKVIMSYCSFAIICTQHTKLNNVKLYTMDGPKNCKMAITGWEDKSQYHKNIHNLEIKWKLDKVCIENYYL